MAGLAARVLTRRAVTPRSAYVVVPFSRVRVPTERERHLLNRLGYGFSLPAYRALRRLGGEQAWLEEQLDPDSITEHPTAEAALAWFPRLTDSPVTKHENARAGRHKAHEYARDLGNWTLVRRICSKRQVHEALVEVWSHHFNVTAKHSTAFTQRFALDTVIREKALGTFEDLLLAVTLHPAMLLYLDNWRSERGRPNENHARELLELHTVGVRGGYTEDMVKDAAKVLSGHSVDDRDWSYVYDSSRHTTGPVSVLGFTHPNGTATDPGLAAAMLRHLARHPATAQHVSRRLAVRFVADRPSTAIVDAMAQAYLSSGTDIRATIRAMVAHPDFWASAGQKVRTPADDVVATARALRVRFLEPTGPSSAVHELSWLLGSTLLFQWPRPDGPPDTAAAWSSTSRMLNSWRFHWGMAGGLYPNDDIRFRRRQSYVPRKGLPFAQLVDKVSRQVLGRESTPQLLEAACIACDMEPGERVTKRSSFTRYRLNRLLVTLLDSPDHMTR